MTAKLDITCSIVTGYGSCQPLGSRFVPSLVGNIADLVPLLDYCRFINAVSIACKPSVNFALTSIVEADNP
jgi:hypothetical protein